MGIEVINNRKNDILSKKINCLVDSIESLLGDISALEVNTMIVDTIIPHSFIPEKAYQDIYLISEEYLEQQTIIKSLWKDYLELKANLEFEYLLIKKNEAELPHISEEEEIKQLFNSSRFLSTLKKLANIKAILDKRNYKLLNQTQEKIPIETDLIYAQTEIHLNGEIINRYSQEILNHPHKDLILEIHRDSIISGQKQWRIFLQNILELLQKPL